VPLQATTGTSHYKDLIPQAFVMPYFWGVEPDQ